jgi:mevalonate kinase
MIIKLANKVFKKQLSLLPNYHYMKPIKKALEEIHNSATQAIKLPDIKSFHLDNLHKAQQSLRSELNILGPNLERKIKARLTNKPTSL